MRWEGRGERTNRPVILGWCSEGAKDDVQLLEICLARHVGYPQHQFCKDAASRPGIHSGAVASCAEEEFRSAVPSTFVSIRHQSSDGGEREGRDEPRHDLAGHLGVGVGVLPCETEICEFESPV